MSRPFLHAELSAHTPNFETRIASEELVVSWTRQGSTPPSAGYFATVLQTSPVPRTLLQDHFLSYDNESFTFSFGALAWLLFPQPGCHLCTP